MHSRNLVRTGKSRENFFFLQIANQFRFKFSERTSSKKTKGKNGVKETIKKFKLVKFFLVQKLAKVCLVRMPATKNRYTCLRKEGVLQCLRFSRKNYTLLNNLFHIYLLHYNNTTYNDNTSKYHILTI